ncbi:MAG: hypothetical protein GEU78_02190 [Actinobacteria bacterium]|nr:hypothetical protein [Actinomycetota bacterium]
MRRPLLGVLFLLLAATGFGLGSIWLGLDRPPGVAGLVDYGYSDLIFAVAQTAFVLLGLMLVMRSPRPAVGWWMVTVGFIPVLASFFYEWAARDVTTADSLPGAAEAAVLGTILAALVPGALANLLARFPDGRLPGPRWRLIPIATVAAVVALCWAGSVAWLDRTPDFILETATVPASADAPFFVGFTLMLGAAAAGVVSLFVRYRRANRLERQQLKWLAVAALLAITLNVPSIIFPFNQPLQLLSGAGVLLIPFAITLAVLRYRLYDIDLVVNRTIVYLLLTVLLAVVYLGGVTLLQGLIGFGGDSDLAVAASTLAVAGLFQPARRRIQNFIDHYFYRRKYDAQRTIDTFSSKLREEIQLDALNDELIDVVQRTMHPAHVSLWVITTDHDR